MLDENRCQPVRLRCSFASFWCLGGLRKPLKLRNQADNFKWRETMPQTQLKGQEDPIHSTIRMPFQVAGQNFEAVGFLNKGEVHTVGYEMLTRVPEEPGAAKRDTDFLAAHLGELPSELQRYWLVTHVDRRGDAGIREACYFAFGWQGWEETWHGLGRQWYHCCLVVRRCS